MSKHQMEFCCIWLCLDPNERKWYLTGKIKSIGFMRSNFWWSHSQLWFYHPENCNHCCSKQMGIELSLIMSLPCCLQKIEYKRNSNSCSSGSNQKKYYFIFVNIFCSLWMFGSIWLMDKIVLFVQSFLSLPKVRRATVNASMGITLDC